MHLNAQIHAKMCQNASLNDYSLKPSSGTKMKNETENMSGFTDETENTHVNWIRTALKVAVRYIDCVLNINQKTKSLIALQRRSFVALIRNKV